MQLHQCGRTATRFEANDFRMHAFFIIIIQIKDLKGLWGKQLKCLSKNIPEDRQHNTTQPKAGGKTKCIPILKALLYTLAQNSTQCNGSGFKSSEKNLHQKNKKRERKKIIQNEKQLINFELAFLKVNCKYTNSIYKRNEFEANYLFCKRNLQLHSYSLCYMQHSP